jgi:hypothetical protein
MSDKFPWKIFILYCIVVLFGFSLIGTVSVMRGPDHGTFQDEFGLGLTVILFSPGLLLVALLALPITMFHDFIRNRMRKKNQEPPAELVQIQSNYERPPEPKSVPGAMTVNQGLFAFNLVVCCPLTAFLERYYDPIARLNLNMFFCIAVLTAIGGLLLSTMGETIQGKVLIFFYVAVGTFPICYLCFLLFS